MKLNFISDCVKLIENTGTSDVKGPDRYSEEIVKFSFAKTEAFGKAKSIYEQKLERSRKMADKKYKIFCKHVEKLKMILNGKTFGKFRIKNTIDGIGRMPFIEKNNHVIENNLPRNRQSLVNFQHLRVAHMPKKSEILIEESEVSTVIGHDSDQEEVVSQVSQVFYTNFEEIEKMDCERIKVGHSLFGFIGISQEYLLFVSEGKEKPKNDFFFGSALEFTAMNKICEKV